MPPPRLRPVEAFARTDRPTATFSPPPNRKQRPDPSLPRSLPVPVKPGLRKWCRGGRGGQGETGSRARPPLERSARSESARPREQERTALQRCPRTGVSLCAPSNRKQRPDPSPPRSLVDGRLGDRRPFMGVSFTGVSFAGARTHWQAPSCRAPPPLHPAAPWGPAGAPSASQVAWIRLTRPAPARAGQLIRPARPSQICNIFFSTSGGPAPSRLTRPGPESRPGSIFRLGQARAAYPGRSSGRGWMTARRTGPGRGSGPGRAVLLARAGPDYWPGPGRQ